MAITASVDEFDNELEDTPVTLEVTIGNGDEDELVTLYMDEVELALATTTLDEYGTSTVDVPIPELAAGTYNLIVSAATNGTDIVVLTVLKEPLAVDAETPDDRAAPVVDLDPAQHWQFIDNTVGDPHSYTMRHNPAKWTTPWRPAQLEHAAVTAPDGNILAWEAGDRAWRFQFSGILTTRADYEALEFWSELRRRFWLVDHRGVKRYVTFEQFDARARVVPNNPWVHDYTVSVIEFSADE